MFYQHWNWENKKHSSDSQQKGCGGAEEYKSHVALVLYLGSLQKGGEYVWLQPINGTKEPNIQLRSSHCRMPLPPLHSFHYPQSSQSYNAYSLSSPVSMTGSNWLRYYLYIFINTKFHERLWSFRHWRFYHIILSTKYLLSSDRFGFEHCRLR